MNIIKHAMYMINIYMNFYSYIPGDSEQTKQHIQAVTDFLHSTAQGKYWEELFTFILISVQYWAVK